MLENLEYKIPEVTLPPYIPEDLTKKEVEIIDLILATLKRTGTDHHIKGGILKDIKCTKPEYENIINALRYDDLIEELEAVVPNDDCVELSPDGHKFLNKYKTYKRYLRITRLNEFLNKIRPWINIFIALLTLCVASYQVYLQWQTNNLNDNLQIIKQQTDKQAEQIQKLSSDLNNLHHLLKNKAKEDIQASENKDELKPEK